jgi:hypothetical protein
LSLILKNLVHQKLQKIFSKIAVLQCQRIPGPVLKRSNQPDAANRGAQVLVKHPPKPSPDAGSGHQRGPQTPAPRKDDRHASSHKPVLKEAFLVDPEEVKPVSDQDDGQDYPAGDRRNQPEGRTSGLMQMLNALRSSNRDGQPKPNPAHRNPGRPKPKPKQPSKKRPLPLPKIRPLPIRNNSFKRPKKNQRPPKPSSSYGAPKAPVIADSYGAPKAPVVDSYGAPQAPVVEDSYGGPKAPPETYSAPAQEAPAEAYNSPAPAAAPAPYSPPQAAPEAYGAPQPAQDSYGSPQQSAPNLVQKQLPFFFL